MTDLSTPGTPAPLSVATDLTLSVNGAALDVQSTGERLFVRVDSIPDALRAARGHPSAATDRLAAALAATDLTVEIRVHDRTVAVAGADARPGAVSRALGTDPVEVRVGGALGALGVAASGVVGALSRRRS